MSDEIIAYKPSYNLRSKAIVKQSAATDSLNALIIDSIQDIKGKKIRLLDLRSLQDAPADYFIVCEGDSSTQVRALADNVYKRLAEEASTKPLHLEGINSNRWVLLDYLNTVVHIFFPEARQFYDLESLWGDAQVQEFDTL